MSFKIAEGYVEVTADGRTALSQAAGIGERVGGSIRGGVGTVFSGNFLSGLALQAGQVIGEGIRSGIDYGVESISLASNLNESFNAIEVTFGAKIAADLGVLAEAAPRELRITQVAFNEFATRFSAFGDKIVGPGGDIVSFLDELTTRGSDFASVYNLEVADALALFQSGLAGESEPLRRYGIDLSEAAVASFAYAHGIAEAGTQLTETEKVQARYGALLEQTSKVQGDAANTSGELAAQQRLLAVGMEEAQTKLGSYLLPGFNALVGIANDRLLPALGDVIDKVGPIFGQALTDSGPKIDEIVTKLGPAVDAFTELGVDAIPKALDGFGEFLDAVPDIVAGLQGIDDAGTVLYDTLVKDSNDWIVETRADFIQWFEDFRQGFNDAVAPGFTTVSRFRSEAVDAPFADVSAHFYGVGDDVATGMANGIRAGKSKAIGAAGDMAAESLREAKRKLGIASPSKAFDEEVGFQVAAGAARGIDRGASMVSDSIDGLFPSPKVPNYFGAGMLGLQSGGATPTIVLQAGAVVIDAKNVQDFQGVVAIFDEINQVARAGRGAGSGEGL